MAAQAIVNLIHAAGFQAWFDKKNLLGGQEWETETRSAIKKARLVIVCLSAQSIHRRGFLFTELQYAIKEAMKLPEGSIFIIPARLNACSIPQELSKWQSVDLYEPEGAHHLLKSIGAALDMGARATTQDKQQFERDLREYNSQYLSADLPKSIPDEHRNEVVILLHGIRTRGKWQKDLSPYLATSKFIPEPLDYGFFRAFRLLLPWSRERQVDWFRDEYTRIYYKHRSVPSIIAHSFGTYMAARAMELYGQIKFNRIIFCGSIVRRDYEWSIRYKNDSFAKCLHDFGRRDFWARIGAWVIKDAGQSGSKGFVDKAQGSVIESLHDFRHSGYFYELNYRNRWIPFLQTGSLEGNIAALHRPSLNWRFVVFITSVIALIIFVGFYFAALHLATKDSVALSEFSARLEQRYSTGTKVELDSVTGNELIKLTRSSRSRNNNSEVARQKGRILFTLAQLEINAVRFLPQADFTYSDLSGLTIGSAEFPGIRLSDSNLRGQFHVVNFAKAHLERCSIGGSRDGELVGSNFDESWLTEADLSGADITGANLYYTDLRFVKLRGIRNWEKATSFLLANIFGVIDAPAGAIEFMKSKGAVSFEDVREWKKFGDELGRRAKKEE